jgi:hypothetical protein
MEKDSENTKTPTKGLVVFRRCGKATSRKGHPKRCLVLLEMCGKATSRKCAKGRRARRNTHKGCLFMLNGCEKATSTTRYPRWVSCCAKITREGNEHDRTSIMDVLLCSNVGVGVGNGVWAWVWAWRAGAVDVSTTLLTGQFPSPVCKVELAEKVLV